MKGNAGLLPACSVGYPERKMAQIEARTATYFLLVSAATDQPSMALINASDSAHHFNVKLSLFMCM